MIADYMFNIYIYLVNNDDIYSEINYSYFVFNINDIYSNYKLIILYIHYYNDYIINLVYSHMSHISMYFLNKYIIFTRVYIIYYL